jgi:P4 family phage/plasmid primase-like protien
MAQTDPQQFSRTMLEAALFTQCDGLTGKKLQAKLEEINNGFDTPADQEYLLELVARYPDKEPEINPIELAIASDDVKELFNVAPLLALLTPLEWGIIKQEIKERYGKKVNLNDLAAAVKGEQRRIKLQQEGLTKDVADIARDWASSHRDDWAYDTVYDVWRVWNGAYWIEQPRTHLLDKEAVSALQEANANVSSQSALNLFERLAEADCLRDFTPAPGLINFDNGTLELATGHLRTYQKEDNLTSCLPYGYNPHSTHPNIDTFLSEVLPDEYARLALMAHAGLALSGDMLMHHFIGLIGAPRSGKSTILALINYLCGAIDPFSFAGHSVFSRDLEGKRSRFKWSQRPIACIDELPQEALREEELLKAMSAHSGVEMRGIGRDEHMNNRWKSKLLMATNEQPRYRDTSSAIKERAIFAEITGARPKEKRNAKLFEDKLKPEIGAFAASCLQLAQQVLARGYYPLSAQMKQLIDRIANEANPFKDFLQECCIIREGEKIPTARLHEAYESFCADNRHKRVMAAKTMSTALRSMGLGVEVKHIRYEGKLQRGLVGIRLRTPEDPDDFTPTYTDDESLTIPQNVNNVNRQEQPFVNTSTQPVEPNQGDVLTMLTNENEVYSLRDTSTPCSVQGRSNPIERVGAKEALTSLTVDANEPAASNGHVNGHKNHSLTGVNTKPDFPCRFCLKDGFDIRRWVWSSVEDDYVCMKCISPAYKEVRV